MRIRRMVQQDFAKLFFDVDMFLAPARSGPANRISEPLDRPGVPATPLIPAGNLAGLPALSLPCGFVEKLPVAIQLVGPPFSENKLIAAGKAFQSQTDWHKQRPPA
jgi:aspartyl-tRNA(Asn)/glutamyl-tRNA(Gln) amidotransferase subunit A